ncbi:ribosome assembly cofactor RimP [uncultured Polaribacter sp.]|jgi:ribosome maturation factor RimP|uniref:ribosome assembly cofactor RimP n=1 Tax=uncultured Polaribacter sp. TaxID=174711 RepID=UPI003703B9B1
MNQAALKDIVDEALALNESLYLIELSISVNNKVQVVVDGDNGVSLSETMRISRAINDNFDREVEDFSLEVSTPDIAHPLKVKRQYIKNLNRILKVKTEEEELEGTLVTADEDKIVLQWKAREPKPVGKGKVTVDKTATLEYTEIKEAKVKILF